MLKSSYTLDKIEAGCDEAGRGCLAGPVYAAAVVLPKAYSNELLNDSKKLTHRQRCQLREVIQKDALAWAVAEVSNQDIDRLNILWASMHAMNLAVKQLDVVPELLLIDGNRFRPELDIPYQCIIKGDAQFQSIAAASILAKTYRDERMVELNQEYPGYGWDKNKGYPTKAHYQGLEKLGITPYHRLSFNLEKQPDLFSDCPDALN